jgi:opacity protein-like surface antigen
MKNSLLPALYAASLLVPSVALAHDEPFTYVRGSQTEPKGELELEQWTTARIGKESGDYLGMDFNTELEYGVTDRFQVAGYLNYNYHHLENAVGSSRVYGDLNRFQFNGGSFELKYQFLSAVKDPVGLALYVEPGYATVKTRSGASTDEVELDIKFIVQKNFLENRLITAFNYTLEPEWERDGKDWETALNMEWTLGASYKITDRWNLGVESRLSTEFEDADLDHSEYLTLFLGPTIHYSADKWTAALTILPQVAGWPDQHGTGGLHLDSKERLEIRCRVTWEF